MRRAVKGLLAALGATAVVLLFVFPTRTLLAEDRSLRTTSVRITALDQENRALAARAKALADPAQIEQIAHEQYGMVLPGQKSYAILPVSSAPAAPSGAAQGTTARHRSWWRSLTP